MTLAYALTLYAAGNRAARTHTLRSQFRITNIFKTYIQYIHFFWEGGSPTRNQDALQ